MNERMIKKKKSEEDEDEEVDEVEVESRVDVPCTFLRWRAESELAWN